MNAPVGLRLCGCADQRRQKHENPAAAIIETGARLRARALLGGGGRNEANWAVHIVLWRLLHQSADLAAMSDDDIQAALSANLPT